MRRKSFRFCAAKSTFRASCTRFWSSRAASAGRDRSLRACRPSPARSLEPAGTGPASSACAAARRRRLQARGIPRRRRPIRGPSPDPGRSGPDPAPTIAEAQHETCRSQAAALGDLHAHSRIVLSKDPERAVRPGTALEPKLSALAGRRFRRRLSRPTAGSCYRKIQGEPSVRQHAQRLNPS